MTTQPDDVTTFLSTWQAAEPSGDATALGEALDDDFTAFGPLGFALSKEDLLERHTTGALKYETFALTELELRPTTASRLHGTPDRNGHLQRPPGSKRASGHDRLERHGRGLAARADRYQSQHEGTQCARSSTPRTSRSTASSKPRIYGRRSAGRAISVGSRLQRICCCPATRF